MTITSILAMKRADYLIRTHPQADTHVLEAESDRLVYGLGGLTEEEIALIEKG
jgi:hypothetical protein